jgi:DNA topoisomerase-6 subunit B
MLGFDSLQRSLITTIKEAVDNALDACEGHDQPDLRVYLMVGYRNPSSPTLGLKSGAGGVWREYQLEAT